MRQSRLLRKRHRVNTGNNGNYLPAAILIYNTICHSSFCCEPSRVFHGRVRHNSLGHKLVLRFNRIIAPITDFADELLRRTNILGEKTKKVVIQSNKKYKNKTKKEQKIPLWMKKIAVSYFSQNLSMKGQKHFFVTFLGSDLNYGKKCYRKIIILFEYLIPRKTKTQLLHRTRLRKYNPENPPEDSYQEAQWQIDDNIITPRDDISTLPQQADFRGHLFDNPII